jgi:16S rRNA (adenine1518-N6/adenine1519-N6)-dimethyltransferase
MKIPPKKSLGQHFLMNPSTIEKILEKADVGKNDRILEIGPGPGRMTEQLTKKAAQVVAVEKDRRFVQTLRERLGGLKNLTIVEGDFLNLELPQLLPSDHGKWKVVANLPYNIATEVVFHLLDSSYLFASFYLMVQREVANRLVARPGSKDYGILSVFSQLFSENRIVMKLPPGAFSPPPKVHSAVVEFKLTDGCRYSIHYLPTFEGVVRSAFGERRKMIRNALINGLPQYSAERIDQALKKIDVRPTARAETVSIEKFVRLANELSQG